MFTSLKVGTQYNGGMEDTIRTIKCVKGLTPRHWEIADLMAFLTQNAQAVQ